MNISVESCPYYPFKSVSLSICAAEFVSCPSTSSAAVYWEASLCTCLCIFVVYLLKSLTWISMMMFCAPQQCFSPHQEPGCPNSVAVCGSTSAKSCSSHWCRDHTCFNERFLMTKALWILNTSNNKLYCAVPWFFTQNRYLRTQNEWVQSFVVVQFRSSSVVLWHF